MTQPAPFKKPIVTAYFTLGRNDLGICKQLSISLQMPRSRKAAESNVIRLERPFSPKSQHRGGLLNP